MDMNSREGVGKVEVVIQRTENRRRFSLHLSQLPDTAFLICTGIFCFSKS